MVLFNVNVHVLVRNKNAMRTFVIIVKFYPEQQLEYQRHQISIIDHTTSQWIMLNIFIIISFPMRNKMQETQKGTPLNTSKNNVKAK